MVNQNSIFGGMLTSLGAAKKTNCDALGIPWEPSYMLIGDANDTDPVPSPGQTQLIRQVYRAPLNALYVSPTDDKVLIAELVLPPEVGGWWIRELAIEDKDGVFCAVANVAPSYKPLLTQGSGRNQVVRMHIITNSTSNIQLKIDPSVVLATRSYVDQRILEELNKQDFKHSVLVATSGAITLSGLQTIDSVALAAGNRVLVKNQVQAKDNGLYVAASGAWSRTQDADTSLEVTPGLFVHVEKGAANGDSVWQLVSDGPIVLDTTDLAFEMLAGRTGVNAGTYTKVTVDKYGRVIAGTSPTTLAGHGIVDAVGTSDKASEEDAVDGVSTTKWMTPFTVLKAIKAAVTQATELAAGIVRFSTQAEVVSTTSDSTAVTPKKLGFGLFVIQSSNGGIIFPKWLGGFAVQWASAAAVPQDGTLAVVFPFEFPTECFHVFPSPVLNAITGNTGPTYGATNITKSGCTLYNEGYACAGTRFWAVGR